MITLHESNITSFPLDNGIGVLSDAIKAHAEEELNGMFEFYMEYDSEGHLVDELKEERIIKAKAQDKLGYQLFRIYSITKNHENDNITVYARHITYDLANNFVESLVATNMTKKQVMEKIGSSTVEPHPFNVTSSNTTTMSSTKLYRTNPIQMIAGMDGSVLQIWGGQLERDNFNLILHDRRGHDDGVTVRYAKNLTGLTAEFDISGLVTRIFPFVFIEATDDTPERLITVSGKYIDSPHINDYEQIYIEPIDYSHDERIDAHEKTDAQIRQQLESVASTYFEETGNDKVKATLDVNFMHLWGTEEYKHVAPLELVGMGDTVTINHSRLKVDATAIVNYIRYDCIAHVNEEVRLGNVKAGLTDSLNKIDTIERKVEQAESNATRAIVSANGKNVTYYGPDEPVGEKGDLWFELVDGQYNRTYRHDGIQWQLIVDMDSYEAKTLANEAKQDAEQSLTTANDAINTAQASFDKAQENATAIDGLGLQIGDVETGLTTISGTVQGLQTTVTDLDGNVSNLTQLSNVLQTTVSSLQDELDNLEIGGRNYALNSDELVEYKSNDRFPYDVSDEIKNHPQTKFSVSFDMEYTGAEDVSRVEIYFYNGEFLSYAGGNSSGNRENTSIGGLKNDGNWDRYEGAIYTVDDIGDKNNITIVVRVRKAGGEFSSEVRVKNMKVEKGTIATDWTPAPEDMATQTQITQLSDAINLRVEKGDVINQINLDTSGVLISGKKLILDGDTTVTGQFKVGNANITSIDAGKVTVGDLVGHSLVGGSVIGGYIEQQSGNRRLEMYNGIIDSFYNNQLAMSFGQYSLEFYNKADDRIGRIVPVAQTSDLGKKGLGFVVDGDVLNIGYEKSGAFRAILRSDFTIPMTALAGPYSNLNSGSSLRLYANRRAVTEDRFTTVDQPSIVLDQSDETNNVDIYYGGFGRRDGAETRFRFRTSDSAYRQVLRLHSYGIEVRDYMLYIGQTTSGDPVFRSNAIRRRTSTNDANVRINPDSSSNGLMYRTTSSGKQKVNIESIPYEHALKVLDLTPSTWYDKNDCETYAEYLSCGDRSLLSEVEHIRRIPGIIAEDVERAGLHEFVEYADNEIVNINSKLWTLLIPITRQHHDDISRLKLENQYLKQKVKQLEEMIA